MENLQCKAVVRGLTMRARHLLQNGLGVVLRSLHERSSVGLWTVDHPLIGELWSHLSCSSQHKTFGTWHTFSCGLLGFTDKKFSETNQFLRHISLVGKLWSTLKIHGVYCHFPMNCYWYHCLQEYLILLNTITALIKVSTQIIRNPPSTV